MADKDYVNPTDDSRSYSVHETEQLEIEHPHSQTHAELN